MNKITTKIIKAQLKLIFLENTEKKARENNKIKEKEVIILANYIRWFSFLNTS